MLDISSILFEGILLSVIFSAIVLLSLYYNPRLWLQDFPKDIQQMTLPKTKREKQQTIFLTILIFILFLAPFFTSLYVDNEQIALWPVFFHFFFIFNIVSLVDLVILDWLIICFFTPSFLIIPGSHGAKGYKDYWFHFVGALKGTFICAAFALILAALRVTLSYL
ncbi:nitroreductase [Paenibacillus arenosi]|uniref:Nitroreductase n=1 Tax=Paenibacillus arenosi TaxID=2774142 RepID=A0ABR9ATY2_9BACL|nr:nitroreductase [Paenibacillus arenosi]MBD8497351.1 nitroreductase [Paenibacillus arenosi]